MINMTSKRKIEHLKLCAESPVESRKVSAGFEDVTLIHRALPELNMDKLNLSIDLLGKRLQAPFLIASITGGHPDTIPVNASLAAAAEELGLGIGVGSQRAAFDDPSQEDSFRVVREKAPNAFVYSNVGAAQIRQYGVDGVEKLIDMIDADALAIHLNFLQEAIQPEGDRDATGCLDMIKEICSVLNTPVIVKETGAGVSREDALLLQKAGVSAIDVGGAGGTSWAGVEVYRARKSGDSASEYLGELLWDFGIPTVASIIESRVSLPIIATGGIRTGIDIAKSIALGASAASAALPFVGPALEGKESVVKVLSRMLDELRIAMFLCGCANIQDLRNAPVVVTGRTLEYLGQRGFNVKDYAIAGDSF
ncbi:type 2 isopentenyl-diphosphate Delta-isomerase [Methanosarcina sp.]|uniref:type 2 isopentenyl-diphosphate Delta-isomerase n=1 Tax=Methanosarcina sp. TaxID=2213 RepID=UPI00298963FE|nr:type 2 isopentenyl-diphosphate Delta-isomerase [Methanosarcina sp.]MDW5550015.1 type 2 isopentenyl-diphosphate Delta-isomerase [Methanosarcina sp.]MDW5553969.1 type 2 isopentenyl-diphosphate Delta-isomerase [Methanosarcina sp.]MDW5558526.1 type 2 isopentenyl-diphosphate Delta-isomerase [Methanosarcina sp.]